MQDLVFSRKLRYRCYLEVKGEREREVCVCVCVSVECGKEEGEEDEEEVRGKCDQF